MTNLAEKYAFLIGTSVGFPQDPKYLELVDSFYQKCITLLKSHSGIGQYVLPLLEDAFVGCVKEHGSGNQPFSGQYGTKRSSNDLSIMQTRLDTTRYPQMLQHVQHYHPQTRQPNSVAFVDLKTTYDETALSTNIIYHDPQDDFVKPNIRNLAPPNHLLVFYADCPDLLQSSTIVSNLRTNYASLDQINNVANFEIAYFLNPTLHPDYSAKNTDEIQQKCMINGFRALTLATSFLRGGSTFSNTVLLAMADHIGINLPLMGRAQSLWAYTSIMPHDAFTQQFKNALDRSGETFFDLDMTAAQVSQWHQDVVAFKNMPAASRRDFFTARILNPDPDRLWDQTYVLPYQQHESSAYEAYLYPFFGALQRYIHVDHTSLGLMFEGFAKRDLLDFQTILTPFDQDMLDYLLEDLSPEYRHAIRLGQTSMPHSLLFQPALKEM